MATLQEISESIRSIESKKQTLKRSFEDLQKQSNYLSSFSLTWPQIDSHFSQIESSLLSRFSHLQQSAQDPDPQVPPNSDIRSICEKMEAPKLMNWMKENHNVKNDGLIEFAQALKHAPDPFKLVLDAIEGVDSKAPCVALLEGLMTIEGGNVGGEVKERARILALKWKQEMGGNAFEALGFLSVLGCYQLVDEFGRDDIVQYVHIAATNAKTMKLCRVLGLEEKVPVSQNKLMLSYLQFVPLLTGTNYAEWKERVVFSISMLNFGVCLREEGPEKPGLEENDAAVLKAYEEWRSNDDTCLKFLRLTTAADIKNSISETDCDTSKKFLLKMKKKFEPSDKAVSGTLLDELLNCKHDETKGNMAKHIMHMQSLVSKLCKLGMKIEDPILTNLIFQSLSEDYQAFHIHYNAIKETWSVDELANKLVQEETRLRTIKKTNIPQAHHVHKSEGSKGKGQFNKGKSRKLSPSSVSGPSGIKKVNKRKDMCHFCKKAGHFQNDCAKRKEWFEKKGLQFNPEHKKQ